MSCQELIDGNVPLYLVCTEVAGCFIIYRIISLLSSEFCVDDIIGVFLIFKEIKEKYELWRKREVQPIAENAGMVTPLLLYKQLT